MTYVSPAFRDTEFVVSVAYGWQGRPQAESDAKLLTLFLGADFESITRLFLDAALWVLCMATWRNVMCIGV